MYRLVLELEVLFGDHCVCSGVITDSLALERMLCERRALAQPPPSALQSVTRQKRRVHFLLDLAVANAFPPHAGEFALQVFDLTHIWSRSDSDVIAPDDIHALTAAVYMFTKLHLSPQERDPRTLPELLTAVAAPLTRQHLVMPQYFIVRAPSSRSHTSNSGCWNSWAVN